MKRKIVFVILSTMVVLICFAGCCETDVVEENMNVTDIEVSVENNDIEVVETAENGEVTDDAEMEDAHLEDETVENEGVDDEDFDVEYIGNRKSLKFHYPWCHSAKAIKESNQVYFYGSRDEVIEEGYNPCWNCEP